MKLALFIKTLALTVLFRSDITRSFFDEPYRPQIHFSTPNMWMNDPNGLVFHRSIYHLFYQHHPYDTIWGPMHWGHAISKDLIHWKHLPIILFPDELGAMFSGCALVDYKNVTGLQQYRGREVMIAIFTQHIEEPNDINNYTQYQSLAFSNDLGVHWTVYKKNPILKSPGPKDFRDPNIFYYKNDYFVMSLAVFDRIMFYKSNNLIDWQKLSEFGVKDGSHGGVWECPDLIFFENLNVWILIVSINPGGVNGGSVTQYFVGDFNGVNFVNLNPPNTTLWVDWGPDNYAGITWFGVKNKSLFIGWLNNWDYARDIPTKYWRGQMTIVRDLTVVKLRTSIYLVSNPIDLSAIKSKQLAAVENVVLTQDTPSMVLYDNLDSMVMNATFTFLVDEMTASDSFTLCWSNKKEQIRIGFRKQDNSYFIDRSQVETPHIHLKFNPRPTAPRLISDKTMRWQLILDVSSIELFADNGLTSMTALLFPKADLNQFHFEFNTSNSDSKITLQSSSVSYLKSIWRNTFEFD